MRFIILSLFVFGCVEVAKPVVISEQRSCTAGKCMTCYIYKTNDVDCVKDEQSTGFFTDSPIALK